MRIETVHAVTYFGQETLDAADRLGITGFWSGYFAFRAAPMGAVAAGVVDATFCNFAPAFVRRWVPAVWDTTTPAAAVEARAAAASATLRRIAPEVDDVAARVNPLLRAATGQAVAAGRALFTANRDLEVPADPVAELWHWTTCLREHRGDGHVAALVAAGVDGLQSHVLIADGDATTATDLQRTRGWTADDWAAAVEGCTANGWTDDDGRLTADGTALRADVEATTDRLAIAPFGELGELLDALAPLAISVSSSGTIRYPNPIGLPAAHDALA